MTIRYMNGLTYEAIMLSRTETLVRVAIQGSDDVVELTCINGAWVSEDCEPVQVDFASTRRASLLETTEEECICSPELAARLLRLLFGGEEEVDAVPVRHALPVRVQHQVV